MNLLRFVDRHFGTMAHPWEGKFDDTCTEEDIYYCFRLILGRKPSEIEWNGHKTHTGNQLKDVVSSYLSSLEFKRRRLNALEHTAYTLVDLGNYKIYASENDPAVGIHICRSKTYEPHVAQAIKSILAPGMYFLDIGANIGYFSLLAASIVGKQGAVFAFEPYHNNVKLLYHSTEANGFSCIKIFPFAVANINGLLLYNNEASNGKIEAVSDIKMSLSSDMVYAVRLDDFLQLDKLDVIKIDVEGAEYMALTGARQLLQKTRPIIFSEFSPPALMTTSGVTAEEYLKILLIDRDYTLSVISEDGEEILCQRDVAKVIRIFENARTDHIDIMARPNKGNIQ